MKKDEWQRARSDDQKSHRINEILEAAASVFQEIPYEKVTMQLIAKEANFTRSNLYRYFKTREEIFLSLWLFDLTRWIDAVDETFKEPVEWEVFIECWTEVLCEQRRLLELTPLLYSSMERNTSKETLKETKLAMFKEIERLGDMVARVLPVLSHDEVLQFLMTHLAMMSGAWPMTQYSSMQLEVQEELAMTLPKPEFHELYLQSMKTYLKGLVK